MIDGSLAQQTLGSGFQLFLIQTIMSSSLLAIFCIGFHKWVESSKLNE